MHPLIDAHAHLCDPAFDADLASVLERAAEAGVAKVVAVSETLDDAKKNLALAAAHPGILPAAGLYPTFLDPDAASAMEAFIRGHRASLVSVGEVGLDFWKVQDDAGREIQKAIFRRFVRLAIELDLPLNVHSRSAGREAVNLLLEEGASRVQMHAFGGRAAKALPGVEAGWFFSIPPSIVHSRQKQKLVKALPPSCLLVETDSPVLGPDRDARNEPANAVLSLQAIAEIKRLPLEAVREAVCVNGEGLYGGH